MQSMEVITALATCINCGVLTAIYYRLGSHAQQHRSHERRLEAIEETLHHGKITKRA